jgi:hypothetical protein
VDDASDSATAVDDRDGEAGCCGLGLKTMLGLSILLGAILFIWCAGERGVGILLLCTGTILYLIKISGN